MAVDAPGQHELSARVDLAAAGSEAGRDGDDALAADPDVRFEYAAVGRDGPAADDYIEFAHSIFTPASLLTFAQRAISFLK
jgi:hypothetical protein